MFPAREDMSRDSSSTKISNRNCTKKYLKSIKEALMQIAPFSDRFHSRLCPACQRKDTLVIEKNSGRRISAALAPMRDELEDQ